MVKHRNRKAGVATFQNGYDAVDNAFIVVGKLKIAIDTHMFRAVDGDGRLNRQIFPARDCNLIKFLELRQFVCDRVDRHNVIFGPDRLNCRRDGSQQTDFFTYIRFNFKQAVDFVGCNAAHQN